MSTANLCTEGGRVVGPQHPVPALPSDHDFGGPSLGCNHLRCARCGEAVRHQAGLSWGATAEQLAASGDWDALADSGALTRDADHRLYACACRVHVEDYDRHLGRPSDWDFDEVPPPWRCAGHPPVVGSVDGVALSTSPDELVARFAIAAPEEAPAFTRDYPVAWLHRLVFLTRPTPVSTALSEACARALSSPDASVRAAMADLFRRTPTLPGGERLATVLRDEATSWFGLANPLAPEETLDRWLQVAVARRAVWVDPLGTPLDPEAPLVLRDVALGPHPPAQTLLAALAKGDGVWLEAQAAQILTATPTREVARDLLYAVGQHAPDRSAAVAAALAAAGALPPDVLDALARQLVR